ncbi:MAG: protocatechuate 3,4-dioxygenase, partial [Betaproteobacteria bacterium]
MNPTINRRRMLIGSASLIGLAALHPRRQVFGADFVRTPRQTEGPFYPLVRPATPGNDLIHVPGQSGVAIGELTLLTGKIIDTDGRPLSGVLVEIWQANGFGRYNDPRDASDKPIDQHFKGYGTFLTADDGAYSFQTIKPVAYPGRTPHIHFALSGKSAQRLVTQMYVAGEP